MKTGIRYISHFEPSGYGNAARNYMLGLIAADHPLTWTPLQGGYRRFPHYRPRLTKTVGDPQLDAICNRTLAYGTVLLHLFPEYIPLWRQVEPGKRLVGYSVWETDRLPAHWPALLNLLDNLLVPCHWNRQVFKHSGVTVPIDVIPHLPDPPCNEPVPHPVGVHPHDYVFYTIGSWTARKAIWKTVQAYWSAFQEGEPVILIVKTEHRDHTASGLKRLRGSTRAALGRLAAKRTGLAPVLLLDQEINAAAIAGLHDRGDCYISLSRSEGWGLGAFQAAASGKPVIITGFGGQLDYLPANLAYLVDYRLVPVVDPHGLPSYTPDQRWAEPDFAHAAHLMRQVYKDRAEAMRRGDQLAVYIAEHFDRNAIIQKLIAAVEDY